MYLINLNGDFAAQIIGENALVLFYGPHDAIVYYVEQYKPATYVATANTRQELSELLSVVNLPVPTSKSEWN